MKKPRKVPKSQPEPSSVSLRDIPEVDFSKGKVRRNPYAARIAAEGYTVHVIQEKPKKRT